jgi:type III secretion system FlhB-like substrate exporter|tara:strand:+ start:119 stop:433 length:315 start_codon:yes stop_codon:yes gene_type:complete
MKMHAWTLVEVDKKKTQKLLKAAAFSYQAERNKSPKLLAFTKGAHAEALLELAGNHNVSITRDESNSLLNQLENLPINKEIPPELYLAISRIYLHLIREGKVNL